MTIFSSQFDRARQSTEAYAGETKDTRFRTPAKVALAGAGAAAAALVAADLAAADAADASADATEWGEGWDTGWDAGAGTGTGDATAEATAESADAGGGDGGAWSYNPDYTGASIGGDGDFFYFTDGDVSYTIG